MNNPTTDENIGMLNKKIFDSILDDDDEQFSQLISQLTAVDINPNQAFQLKSYKLPIILSSSPPYACVCAFFSSKKCFDSLTLLISEGLNSQFFKACDKLDRSLVHFACAGGNIDIIRELEQANFELDIEDKTEKTPSNYAAMFGQTDVVKYLWTKGVDILQKDSLIAPIHEACKYGNLEIIKFICENIDSNALLIDYYDKSIKNRGNTLHLACNGGHVNVVNYIISNKNLAMKLINKFDGKSRTPLICACENGSLECVKALVNFGNFQFNNNHRKKLPLVEAAANGHSDIVQYLLMQKDCDINAKNSNKINAIEAAIINGRFQVVDILIKNGAIKNFNENEIGNLFLDACGTFNIEMVKLLDKVLNVPYEKMGDLFMRQACKIENKKLITFLLEKNCKLNDFACSEINFKTKWTPFMTFLKKNGADFSHLKLSNGDLLIVHSIHECASLSSIQQLISEGVVLDEQIISENNLIYTVASMGRCELFEFLSSFKPKLTKGEKCFRDLESCMADAIRIYHNPKYFNDCLKIAEALLRDYNVDSNDSVIVSYAFKYSLIEVLELLSKYNSKFSNIRISTHSWYHDYDPKSLDENVEFLKRKNVDINKILSNEGYPLIIEAIKTAKSEIIQDLISKGFELNREIISKYDLIYEICFYQNFDLFHFLISFKPEIKRIKSCVMRFFGQYMDAKHNKNSVEMNGFFEIIKTLFTQYEIDPNNEIFINYAVLNKLIDLLDFLASLNADFNCCYIDYSNLVFHDYLEVFANLEKHGCLFQKAKFTHINIHILPISHNCDDINLFKDEKDTSPIQENVNSMNRSGYDINTLLFLLKYSTNDDIINLTLDEKNIIDILLEYKCYNEIINVFTKLEKIILPNLCSEEDFKELISKNINLKEQSSDAQLIINSLYKQ